MSIILHSPARERDHVPSTSVALAISPQDAAFLQRTDWHVDLSDDALRSLACRSSRPVREAPRADLFDLLDELDVDLDSPEFEGMDAFDVADFLGLTADDVEEVGR